MFRTKVGGGEQALAVSEDNGLADLQGAAKQRDDLSVADHRHHGTLPISVAPTAMVSPHGSSRDKGKTWGERSGCRLYQGINNTVFPAVTAGDSRPQRSFLPP